MQRKKFHSVSPNHYSSEDRKYYGCIQDTTKYHLKMVCSKLLTIYYIYLFIKCNKPNITLL